MASRTDDLRRESSRSSNSVVFLGSAWPKRGRYAASVVNSTGSRIEGSSFSGLLTRVEIGHIRIRSAGYGRIKSRGSGCSVNHRS
jgi:hypothetical protein